MIPLQKEIKDKYGNAAFVHARKSKHADVARILRDHEAPLSASLMREAAAEGIEEARPHLSDEDMAEFSDIFNNDLYLGGLGHTPDPWVREDSIFIHRQCTPSEDKACRVCLEQGNSRMS